MNQRKFADAPGVSGKTVSKWEYGSGMPDVSNRMLAPVSMRWQTAAS